MFDIQAAKRELGIKNEQKKAEFKPTHGAIPAIHAIPDPKNSTNSTNSTLTALDFENHLEAAEERAAIMEYEAGLSRVEAEGAAIEAHLRPYHFITIDGGGRFLLKGSLDQAREALEWRFRKKLISVFC